MKKLFITLIALFGAAAVPAQRHCGFEIVRASLINRDPLWEARYNDQRALMQATADGYRRSLPAAGARTTAAVTVPVVFHFLITIDQFNQLGGDAGISRRVDSQIVVLNRDYNRANQDSGLIPSGWKPLWGNTGVHFALAHTNPMGYGCSGYDVKIIPSSPAGFTGVSNGYSSVKHNSSGGQDAWDVTKYLNIWCVNFVDISGLLGLTVSKSQTGGSGYPADEMGLCINYVAVGKRTFSTDYFIPTGFGGDYYDMGRTITHEMGHFFEVWHTWGDDGGQCPWSGGLDDGLADTPPEGDHKFYAYAYDVPGGTYRDSCHLNGAVEMQPIGVASLDFMNYTDDVAMQLFTPDQAAVIASQVAPGGAHYSLTQHPELLDWGPVAVQGPSALNTLTVSPNPSNGIIYITFDQNAGNMQTIEVTDQWGRSFQTAVFQATPGAVQADLSGLAKGIYFVRCTFASGSITKKLWLQ